MEFAITKEQRHFFETIGAVEFEGCLSEKDLKVLNEALQIELKRRFNVTDKGLQALSPLQLFQKGRNLSQDSKALSRILFKRSIATLAAELSKSRILRYGLDQLFFQENLTKLKSPFESSFSIQGIEIGVLICLDSKVEKAAELGVEHLIQSPFTGIKGNIVFISKTYQFDERALQDPGLEGASYLLLTYANPRSVYVHKEADELTHHLKQKGYNFGDKLSDEDHPILIR